MMLWTILHGSLQDRVLNAITLLMVVLKLLLMSKIETVHTVVVSSEQALRVKQHA